MTVASFRIESMFEGLPPAELIGVVEDARRQQSRLMARKLAAIAALLADRTDEVLETDPDPGYAEVNGFQRTAAEVAAAMNLSARAASFMFSHAETLDTRLPKIAALLAEG